MPGRESPVSRGGAQALAPARRLPTPYASRRPPGSHMKRPRLAAVQLDRASPAQVSVTASRQGQRFPVLAETAPACARCAACLKASQEVLHAYNALLLNSKRLFIDDALHHYSGDEAWIRVLRALGWCGGGVPAHIEGTKSDSAQR
ncbi:hypothetical protein LSCM1_04767 [Leishmania martiniquensis]|uniref:Uncharacterized protein n=1 Tax=Leishmania martiniquensis TaxID=1580590 RepID=A0A836HKA5_9TRYP|nr:hypothetical protein LSCM1_04767 [Leishmania martiniquensis]